MGQRWCIGVLSKTQAFIWALLAMHLFLQISNTGSKIGVRVKVMPNKPAKATSLLWFKRQNLPIHELRDSTLCLAHKAPINSWSTTCEDQGWHSLNEKKKKKMNKNLLLASLMHQKRLLQAFFYKNLFQVEISSIQCEQNMQCSPKRPCAKSSHSHH